MLFFTPLTVDYNSWIESDKGRKLRHRLDPDTVLAEGYKEFETGRTYLVSMGDWRKDKDEEIELDGVGGVNIVVKADVHRTGTVASCLLKYHSNTGLLTFPIYQV